MQAITIALYLIVLVIGFIVWTLPFSAEHLLEGLDVRITLAIATAYTLLHMLAVGLFLVGLRHFTDTLRKPYLILCAGLITVALAQLQAPIVLLFNATWVITSGLLLILFIVPSILIYAGIRLFARTLGITHFLTLFRVAMPLTLVLPAISFLLPVNLTEAAPNPLTAHIFVGLPLWQMGVYIACAYLVWRIKHITGAAYTNAMHWLFITFCVYIVSSLHYTLAPYTDYQSTWYYESGAHLLPLVVVGTFFVVAGYKFCRIGAHETVQANGTVIDVVIYVAGLATNMNAIDPILDKVRAITANMTSDQELSEQEQQRLAGVYLELEDYLVHREPLRQLTQQEIRRRINERFRPDGQRENVFWRGIGTGEMPPQDARPLSS